MRYLVFPVVPLLTVEASGTQRHRHRLNKGVVWPWVQDHEILEPVDRFDRLGYFAFGHITINPLVWTW